MKIAALTVLEVNPNLPFYPPHWGPIYRGGSVALADEYQDDTFDMESFKLKEVFQAKVHIPQSPSTKKAHDCISNFDLLIINFIH